MILIDEIVSRRSDLIVASVTVRPANLFFRPTRGMPSHVAIEWMAQTCGAFAGSEAMDEGSAVRIGFLLGTRDFRATRSWFPDGTRLLIRAHLEYHDNEIANFSCEVVESLDGPTVAAASLNVFHPNDARALIDSQVGTPT
ncbi:MAG: 3-hydroxylacyl-ACP dehydratase [Proteobacteria bacterium]|nr:3-hydroxylacyl-ACP dehydratase [Pseudomonadota bacterium]